MNNYLDDVEFEIPKIQNYSMADTCYENIKEEIAGFQNELDEEHEIGVMLTNFGKQFLMRVSSLGYHNPNLIFFYGDVDMGNGKWVEAQLIQHISQINFLLTALPKAVPNEPPRRIGFTVDD